MNDLTEIVCIIDKSGSMFSLRDDTIGGFNNFLAEQKALPGKANLTLTLFDTEVTIQSGKDIQEVAPLDTKTYVPSGTTALLDAIGKTLADLEKRLSETPEADRAEKVMVVIITDGQENSSREYSKKTVADKTKALQAKGWEFVYFGANQDAFAEADGIGLQNAVNYTADSHGTRAVYMNTSAVVTNYRQKK